MTWRLITFGRSEVLRDGVSIPLGARGAGHAVKLLVYLVLNPEPHDREALARRLWGNSSREERSTILRKQLHELRRLFGAESIRGDGELVWTMELPCDATELLALDRIDDDTLSLYAGDFLQSWHNQDNRHPREFWDWVLRTREELRDRAWRLVNDRAKAVAETGDWNTLERVGERLIQLRSDRDESHSWYMHALAERGDVSSALRDFERYRETMCSVERSPGPELTALATAIAAGRHRLSMIPAHPLPNAEDPEPNAVQSIAAASAPPPVVMPRSGMSRPLRIGSGALVVAVVVLLARSAASNGNVAARAPARSAAVAGCRDRAGRATLVAETRHRGTILEVGQRFTKGWTLKNTGECAWTPDFRLHFVRQEGEPLTSARGDRPLGVTVAPGQRATLDVPMRAPSEPGLAREAWALLDASGAPVVIDEFEQLVVAIRARRRLSPACRPGQEHAELAGTSHSDNQVLSMGESFEGSWSILNDGDCAWPAHMRLRRSRESAGALSGDPSHVESAEVVQPGAVTTFRVAMLAPNTPGRYREDWEVVDNNGRIIPVGGGRSMMLRVVVVPAADLASQIRPPTCRSTDAQAGFVSETPRDSTRVAPGARFEKVWTIANTGDCRWEPPLGVRFLRSSGERMSLVSAVPLRGSVMPRQTYSFVVPMRAPTNTGLHTETWELVNEHGAPLRVSASSTIWAIIMSRP